MSGRGAQFRQTIVYGSGRREYVQVWLWHSARTVERRLRQELASGVRPERTILEQRDRGIVFDSDYAR